MKRVIGFFFSSLAFGLVAKADLVTSTFVQNKAANWSHAPEAVASQSSTNGAGVASRAIDGNYNGAWNGNSVTHTLPADATAYWQVDLGQARLISDITLFNRTDCCAGRLSNFTVRVSDDSTFVAADLWTSGNQAAAVGLSASFPDVNGTTARYVRIQRDGPSVTAENPLSFAEVDVLGAAQFSFENLALGSTATQSTTLNNAALPTADKAIDGNFTNAFGSGSTTHTSVGVGGAVFWETTLASVSSINEIALYNRGDCCKDRLSNFRLSVFDGATEVWGRNFFEAPEDGSAQNIFSVQEDTGGFFAVGDRIRVELIGGLNNGATGSDVLSLREVEIYGIEGNPVPFEITRFSLVDDTVELTWNSKDLRVYAIAWSTDLKSWVEITDNYPSGGSETTYKYSPLPGDPPADPAVTGKIFFRVEEVPNPG